MTKLEKIYYLFFSISLVFFFTGLIIPHKIEIPTVSFFVLICVMAFLLVVDVAQGKKK